MLSKEIIEILNKDEKATNLRNTFYKAMEKHGKDFTEEEKLEAVKLMMMLAIKQNVEALDLMAETAYHELRKGE